MQTKQLEFLPLLAACYALSIYGFALVWGNFLLKLKVFRDSATTTSSRFGALDGFRGVLAVGVMVHHSFIAYVFFTTGAWQSTRSPIINQLGETTVALFFMITGFLFTIKASATSINWRKFFLSRLARLAPLYAVVVLAVFLLVLFLSNGVLRESVGRIMEELLQWLLFACFERPEIDAFPMTWTLVAGVNWSLKYEVFFYIFAVPAIHMLHRQISDNKLLLSTLLVILGILLIRFEIKAVGKFPPYDLHFLGGILVAQAYKVEALRKLMGSTAFKALAVVSFFLLTLLMSCFSALAVVCTIILFASVIGGASVCGLLKSKAAIWLGDISYGIYLIHGLVLWVALDAIKNISDLSAVNVFSFLILVMSLASVVILLASISYTYLEKPFMRRAAAIGRA